MKEMLLSLNNQQGALFINKSMDDVKTRYITVFFVVLICLEFFFPKKSNVLSVFVHLFEING